MATKQQLAKELADQQQYALKLEALSKDLGFKVNSLNADLASSRRDVSHYSSKCADQEERIKDLTAKFEHSSAVVASQAETINKLVNRFIP